MTIEHTEQGTVVTTSYGVDLKKEPMNLFYIVFAVHVGREWRAYSGYIFAKDEERIKELLIEKYNEIVLRVVEPIEIKEGKILYGELWRSFD